MKTIETFVKTVLRINEASFKYYVTLLAFLVVVRIIQPEKLKFLLKIPLDPLFYFTIVSSFVKVINDVNKKTSLSKALWVVTNERIRPYVRKKTGIFLCRLQNGLIILAQKLRLDTLFTLPDKKRIRIIGIIVCVIVVINYTAGAAYYSMINGFSANLEKRLVLWLPFENNDGNKLENIGSSDKEITIHGITEVSEGKKGMALKFINGSYVRAGKWVSPFTTEYTIAGWINIEKFPKDKRVSSYLIWREDDAPGIRFEVGGTRLYVATDGNFEQFLELSINPDDFLNKWNHVVITFDNSILRLYINGRERAQKISTIQHYTNNRHVRIGGDGKKERSINGSLDDFKIFDRSLQPGEVFALFRGDIHPFLFSRLMQTITFANVMVLVVFLSYIEFLRKKEK